MSAHLCQSKSWFLSFWISPASAWRRYVCCDNGSPMTQIQSTLLSPPHEACRPLAAMQGCVACMTLPGIMHMRRAGELQACPPWSGQWAGPVGLQLPRPLSSYRKPARIRQSVVSRRLQPANCESRLCMLGSISIMHAPASREGFRTLRSQRHLTKMPSLIEPQILAKCSPIKQAELRGLLLLEQQRMKFAGWAQPST